MKDHLHVSLKHLDEGTPESCASCPVALAILDLLKPGTRVEVSCGTVAFRVEQLVCRVGDDNDFICQLNLPNDLVRLVYQVDGDDDGTGAAPQPGDYYFPELFQAIQQHNI